MEYENVAGITVLELKEILSKCEDHDEFGFNNYVYLDEGDCNILKHMCLDEDGNVILSSD